MFLRLLLRLVVAPDDAWSRVAALEREAGAMPTPLGAAARITGIAAVATLLGAAWLPGATVGSVLLHTLAATGGMLGAAVLAVFGLAPRLPIADSALVSRWVSTSILPMLALQSLAILPMRPLAFAWTLFGAALSAATALAGLRAYLGLDVAASRPVALRTVALTAVPMLAANTFRVFVVP